MPNTSPPTDQDHSSKKRRGRTRRGRRGGRKTRRSEPVSQPSPSEPVAPASAELDIGIVFAERSKPATRPPLLDAAAARRLAADARRREQASREALEATRRALHLEVQPVPAASREVRNDTTARAADALPGPPARESDQKQTASSPAPEPGTRAPANRTPESDTRIPATRTPEVESSGWQQVPLRPQRADEKSQELEATLAIARETALAQRSELAELRSRIDTRDQRIAALDAALQESTATAATASEPSAASEAERVAMQAALDESRREVETLRQRLAIEERAHRTLDAERQLLAQKLEAQESQLAARSRQVEELRDRLEAQEEALHATRREYELERTRHSASLQMLSTLRSLLSELPETAAADSHIDPDAACEPEDARPAPEPGREAAPPVMTFATLESAAAPRERAATELAPDEPDAAADDEPSEGMLPPIFDAWQDDQIRRQFGPMGIDCFGDLLRVPLSRTDAARSTPQTVLLIGRGAGWVAGTLAESLVRQEIGAFQIHVADPSGEDALDRSGLSSDSPLRELITPVEFPIDPDALDATLECLRPRAIVSRDFLSRQANVAPWLACLERATTRGASLILSEGTGTPSVTPPPEVAQVGERIWELMPERYTREPGSNRRIAHWREAFDSREAARPNELVAGMRERFRLEMFMQFGFLAEPFLTSSIGWNFDPVAARDRRFLAQVADLDDRRIEAGLVPALHLVALVDPLADD